MAVEVVMRCARLFKHGVPRLHLMCRVLFFLSTPPAVKPDLMQQEQSKHDFLIF